MSRNSGKRHIALSKKRTRRNRGEIGKLPKYKRHSNKVNSEKQTFPFEKEMEEMSRKAGVN